MKSFLIAASAVATLAPVAMPAPALALDRGDVRREQRECRRELRKADSRREYNRELRECRREINREVRDNRRDRRENARDWRRHRNYDGYGRGYAYNGNNGAPY